MASQGVNNPGFLRFELQSHLAYPCCDILFRFLYHTEILVYDHKVSSAGESHSHALAEPYVNVSAHTAPTVEPRRTPICQWANNPGSRREIRAIPCAARRL